MSRRTVKTFALGLAIAAEIAGAEAQSGDAALSHRVGRDAFNVTSGTVQEQSGPRLVIELPEVRAVLRFQTTQAAAVRFTYLGPTTETKPLASGEVRRQFGLKLRAQDTCNLVYVMWHIEPDTRLAVSVKQNPGQRTHAQCGARGYTNLRPHWVVPISPVIPGVPRMLRAELSGSDLTVRVDGAVAWKGALPTAIAAINGPVGFRSDNVRLEFEYYVEESKCWAAWSGRDDSSWASFVSVSHLASSRAELATSSRRRIL